MLGEIYQTLKKHLGNPLPFIPDEFDAKFGKEFGVKFGVKFGVNEKKVLMLLASNPSLSAENIASPRYKGKWQGEFFTILVKL